MNKKIINILLHLPFNNTFQYFCNVNEIIDIGDFVSDEIIIGMIEKRFLENNCRKGYLLDGFPRNLIQANDLEALLKKLKDNINFVFEFVIKKNVLLERILKRSIEDKVVRADDNEHILKKRIEI